MREKKEQRDRYYLYGCTDGGRLLFAVLVDLGGGLVAAVLLQLGKSLMNARVAL